MSSVSAAGAAGLARLSFGGGTSSLESSRGRFEASSSGMAGTYGSVHGVSPPFGVCSPSPRAEELTDQPEEKSGACVGNSGFS